MNPPQTPQAIARDLFLAAGMAFLAGATDVYGLGKLGHLFVSFMSGNTTKLGVALGQSHWNEAGKIAGLIGLFVLGAALGELVSRLRPRRHAALVAFMVATLLAVPVVLPAGTVTALLLAMGALNASMTRIGQFTVSLTYVTGSLVRFGQWLASLCCGKRDGWGGLLQLPLWLSLLAGAVAATITRSILGDQEIWPLPALALLIAAAMLSRPAQAIGNRPG